MKSSGATLLESEVVPKKYVTKRVWTSRLLTMKLKSAEKRRKELSTPDDTLDRQIQELEVELKETRLKEQLAEDRVRVARLAPIGPNSVSVMFDILPEGYHAEKSRSTRLKKLDTEVGRTKKSCRMTEEYLNHKTALGRTEKQKQQLLAANEGQGAMMNSVQVREWDTEKGQQMRRKLMSAFSDLDHLPSIAHHHCSGLTLETQIDLKDLDNNARFFRAVFMLATTVLYYPVFQATLPVVTCFEYTKYRFWDTKAKCGDKGPSICPAWKFAYSDNLQNTTETEYYLTADMSEKCYEGYRFQLSFIIAMVVLGMCIVCPFVALYRIRKSKHAAEGMAREAAIREGRKPREKKKVGFCRQLFMGTHRVPSRREQIEFEQRILRDPYSSLYGMCEQRAYYWFIIDLLRKAIVTFIYTVIGGLQKNYILLVFFVVFAINQDIAQPYRGRTENLFAFITLMFIIVLIHTSTIVTYGSMLPMFMAAAVVVLVLVIFFCSFIFAKKAEKERQAEEEKIKRRAQDLWGDVASKVLVLDPSTATEEKLQEAFKAFDNGNEEDSDGEGEIDIKELKALRDSDRKLATVEGQEPLKLYGFTATDDEIDAMAEEADNDGAGKIDYNEFVAVIFSSWERKQQLGYLTKWLFTHYRRTGDVNKGVKTKSMRKKYLNEDGKQHSKSELMVPVKFNGLLDSLGTKPPPLRHTPIAHHQGCCKRARRIFQKVRGHSQSY